MIIRVKKTDQPYVMVRKHFINDKRLSLKAKGIMVYLLSKPDGWHVRVGDLVNQNRDGEKAVRSGIKELRDYKYMVPNIERDETGKITKFDYDVHEVPFAQNRQVDKPLAQNRQVGKRQVGNRQLNNNIIKVNNELNKSYMEDNNNNKSIKDKNIIIVPQTKKRKYKKIQQKILNMGWIGPLDEIIEIWNRDPKYIIGWVERIENIDIENKAGLLRKSIRSGDRVPTRDEIERAERKKYLDDEFADAII